MPPSRRRPVPTTPTTRPRVAGLRKRTAADPAATREADAPLDAPLGASVTPVEDAQVEGSAADDVRAEDAGAEDAGAEGSRVRRGRGERSRADDELGLDEPAVDERAADKPAADKPAADEPAADEPAASATDVPGLIEPGASAVEDDLPEPAPRPRPTGRRKRVGEAVAPSVLTDPEPSHPDTDTDTDTEAAADWAARHRASAQADAGRSGLVLPVALVVLAGLLVALGVWFQGRAGEVRYNGALVDSGGTTEVAGQTREAVEKAFSYNFADVSATEEAANELLVGKARCQYNAIFGPVRTLAPEQKLVVTVKAVSSGVTSLDGDRATVLLFLDQVTTRTTDNQSGGGIAMMRVGAQKVDGRWKVDNMEMFGQTGDQAAETAKC